MIFIKEIFLSFFLYFTSAVLLHFAYDFSNKNKIVAIFASVNESIWEHIKLLITPIFLFSTIGNIICKNDNYFFILMIKLLLAIFLINFFFIIKVKLFKNRYGFLNILNMIITTLIISIVSYYLKYVNIPSFINSLSSVIVMIIFIMYLSFTFFPPKTSMFKDYQTFSYGINDVK